MGYHGYIPPAPFSHLNGPSDEGFKGGNPPDAAAAGAGGGARSCGRLWMCGWMVASFYHGFHGFTPEILGDLSVLVWLNG